MGSGLSVWVDARHEGRTRGDSKESSDPVLGVSGVLEATGSSDRRRREDGRHECQLARPSVSRLKHERRPDPTALGRSTNSRAEAGERAYIGDVDRAWGLRRRRRRCSQRESSAVGKSGDGSSSRGLSREFATGMILSSHSGGGGALIVRLDGSWIDPGNGILIGCHQGLDCLPRRRLGATTACRAVVCSARTLERSLPPYDAESSPLPFLALHEASLLFPPPDRGSRPLGRGFRSGR